MRGFIAILVLALAGCTAPAAIIGSNGLLLHGTVTESIGSTSFSATDGKLTCSGSAFSSNGNGPGTTAVSCSDGRKGVLIMDHRSGAGRLRLTDGTEADFVIGSAAQSLSDGPAH